MRYCNKTKRIIDASYKSLTIEEIQELLIQNKLTPRTKESIEKYIIKLEAKYGNLTKVDIDKEWARRNPVEHRVNTLYASAKYRANVRKIPFTIDKDWIRTRIKAGTCEVTGIQFNIKHVDTESSQVHRHAPSIDQINPGAGYTKENSRLVVDQYNKMKNDKSDYETYELALEIVKKYNCQLTQSPANS